jgi:hypothetical protein
MARPRGKFDLRHRKIKRRLEHVNKRLAKMGLGPVTTITQYEKLKKQLQAKEAELAQPS